MIKIVCKTLGELTITRNSKEQKCEEGYEGILCAQCSGYNPQTEKTVAKVGFF